MSQLPCSFSFILLRNAHGAKYPCKVYGRADGIGHRKGLKQQPRVVIPSGSFFCSLTSCYSIFITQSFAVPEAELDFLLSAFEFATRRFYRDGRQ